MDRLKSYKVRLHDVRKTHNLSKPLKVINSVDSGQVVFEIMKDCAPLMRMERLTAEQIERKVSMVCRKLTGSIWVELLIKDHFKLKVCGEKQSLKYLEIDEDSLPGYVALRKKWEIINHISTSVLYNAFSKKLSAFSTQSDQRIQATNVAAVPIIDCEGEVQAVIILFNKQDANKSLKSFSDNDITLIQSVGLILTEVLKNQTYFTNLLSKNEKTVQNEQHQLEFHKTSMEQIRKQHLFQKLQKAIEESTYMNTALMGFASEILSADLAILHIVENDMICPLYIYGVESERMHNFNTKTSEFCAFSTKNILNVSDLMTDPLWDRQIFVNLKSLLACPIVKEGGKTVAVLEFFRKDLNFSELDEKLAHQICYKFSELDFGRLMNRSLDFHDKALKKLLLNVKTFNLKLNYITDYAAILSKATLALSSLLANDAATVYIADNEKEKLWTQRSSNCEPIFFRMSENTLLSKAYHTRKLLIIPGEDSLDISDFDTFKGDHVMTVPVLGNLCAQQCIAILQIFRKSTTFTENEVQVAKSFAGYLGLILENIFISEIPNKSFNSEDRSQTNATPSNQRLSKSKMSRTSLSEKNSSSMLDSRITSREKLASLASSSSESVKKFYKLADIPNNRMYELKQLFESLKSEKNPLHRISLNLKSLIPCEEAKLLMNVENSQNLRDVTNESLIVPAGFIKQCIDTNSYINQLYPFKEKEFDPNVDSLGIESRIESMMVVPIPHITDSVLGVIVFVNANISFTEDDLAIAEYVSILARELILGINQETVNLQILLHKTRRHKMLQYWCKRVFEVSNTTLNKFILAKDVMEILQTNLTVDDLIQCSLHIICSLIDAEDMNLIYTECGSVFEYNREGKKTVKKFSESENEILPRLLEEKSPMCLANFNGKENMLIVPFVPKKGEFILIETCNKRDETLTEICNFTKGDQIVIKELTSILSKIFYGNEIEQSVTSLRQLIGKYASGLNTHSLISTIRCAAQKLINTDRATVFIRDGKNMVVKSQGIEHEMPESFSVPLGKGIVGHVAQTGQTENIRDVYADTRFDQSIDKKTGYKTRNMLCMPVLNNHGEVIAALQMINKKSSSFDKDDEETLSVFSEMVATVLQNWTMFQKSLEERTRLLNILSSIGNYILVFSSEHTLQYSNKPISDIFGVSDKLARANHYQAWLKANRQLVYDITDVYQNPDKKVHRTSQPIVCWPSGKPISNLPHKSLDNMDSNIVPFHYTITSLKDLHTLESSGVVVILEDATALEELSIRVKEMEMKLSKLATPVQAETSLQKCIIRLSKIAKTLDSEDAVYRELATIINVMKGGNLSKTEIKVNKHFKGKKHELASCIKLYSPYEFDSESVTGEKKKLSSITAQTMSSDLGVNIDLLNDWNLNAFEIEEHFLYVRAMLIDFDLINNFNIDLVRLENFVDQVKLLYGRRENPFHNFKHGFSVMHSSFLILAKTTAVTLFAAHEIYALLIASLCHDIDHTGHSNAFEVNRGSQLAVQYNDRSVLEMHHSAVTFKLLQQDKCDILCNMTHEMRRAFRKLAITAILATDMSKHFHILSRMQSRFSDLEERPIGSNEKDKEHVAQMLLHTADLAHPTKSVPVYMEWSRRVCEEFTNQYKEEMACSIETSPMMKDLDIPKVYYKSELGFLTVIVKPLWECLNLWLFPNINECMQRLKENIEEYERLHKKALEESAV
jgi:GAF domain-containing protein